MTLDIPKKYRGLYQKAKSGKDRTAAIKLFCLECVQFDPKEVQECTDLDCPLYPYRLTGRNRKDRG